MRGTPARALAVAAALAAVAACSDDDDRTPAPATSTTTTTAAPTSTARPTSTATSEATAATLPGGCPTAEPPLATGDLDGDGTVEVWRPAGAGASVDVVELRVLGEACEEVPVRQFAVGGTVRHLNGLRCEPGRLVELQATSEDGERWAVEVVTWQLSGTQLVEAGREAREVLARDPGFDDLSSFEC